MLEAAFAARPQAGSPEEACACGRCGHCGHKRHLQHLGEQPPLLGASPIFTGTICACFVQDPLCPQCGICPPTLLVLYQQHCVVRILIVVTQTSDMGHSLIFLHRYCLSLVPQIMLF